MTKKAIIVAMAAMTGSSIAQESAAMEAAMQDMQAEYGNDEVCMEYTWDPFDGMYA